MTKSFVILHNMFALSVKVSLNASGLKYFMSVSTFKIHHYSVQKVQSLVDCFFRHHQNMQILGRTANQMYRGEKTDTAFSYSSTSYSTLVFCGSL